MLEVVGVTGVVHMGQIQSGLRNGIRIAQGGHVRVFYLSKSLSLSLSLSLSQTASDWLKSFFFSYESHF